MTSKGRVLLQQEYGLPTVTGDCPSFGTGHRLSLDNKLDPAGRGERGNIPALSVSDTGSLGALNQPGTVSTSERGRTRPSRVGDRGSLSTAWFDWRRSIFAQYAQCAPAGSGLELLAENFQEIATADRAWPRSTDLQRPETGLAQRSEQRYHILLGPVTMTMLMEMEMELGDDDFGGV